MADVRIIQVDTDMVVEVSNLRNSVSQALISNAVITAELLDLSDVPVTGSTNPFSVPAIAGTEGLYRATLSNLFDTVAGVSYKLRVVINAGAGLFTTETIPVEARE